MHTLRKEAKRPEDGRQDDGNLAIGTQSTAPPSNSTGSATTAVAAAQGHQLEVNRAIDHINTDRNEPGTEQSLLDHADNSKCDILKYAIRQSLSMMEELKARMREKKEKAESRARAVKRPVVYGNVRRRNEQHSANPEKRNKGESPGPPLENAPDDMEWDDEMRRGPRVADEPEATLENRKGSVDQPRRTNGSRNRHVPYQRRNGLSHRAPERYVNSLSTGDDEPPVDHGVQVIIDPGENARVIDSQPRAVDEPSNPDIAPILNPLRHAIPLNVLDQIPNNQNLGIHVPPVNNEAQANMRPNKRHGAADQPRPKNGGRIRYGLHQGRLPARRVNITKRFVRVLPVEDDEPPVGHDAEANMNPEQNVRETDGQPRAVAGLVGNPPLPAHPINDHVRDNQNRPRLHMEPVSNEARNNVRQDQAIEEDAAHDIEMDEQPVILNLGVQPRVMSPLREHNPDRNEARAQPAVNAVNPLPVVANQAANQAQNNMRLDRVRQEDAVRDIEMDEELVILNLGMQPRVMPPLREHNPNRNGARAQPAVNAANPLPGVANQAANQAQNNMRQDRAVEEEVAHDIEMDEEPVILNLYARRPMPPLREHNPNRNGARAQPAVNAVNPLPGVANQAAARPPPVVIVLDSDDDDSDVEIIEPENRVDAIEPANQDDPNLVHSDTDSESE